MASYNKFNSFVEAIAEKEHNLGNDQLKIALTNSAPSAANTKLSNITEISYTNCSSREVTTISSSQSEGTYKLIVQDLTLSASGGDVGPFRYVVLYNDTATDDLLIGWWDYGESITLHNGESILLDFSQTEGLLTIQ